MSDTVFQLVRRQYPITFGSPPSTATGFIRSLSDEYKALANVVGDSPADISTSNDAMTRSVNNFITTADTQAIRDSYNSRNVELSFDQQIALRLLDSWIAQYDDVIDPVKFVQLAARVTDAEGRSVLLDELSEIPPILTLH